ncbi:MAG: ABC transporter permease [Gammaproteobacteria bacterium]|nr:ABC transporter permease [Gammaproteobacteria bacterium]
MQNHSVHPWHLCLSLWHRRQLIWQMSKREVVSRYRGSVMGLLWSFFHPVFMLLIYTFVFSVVFQVKWGLGHSEGKTEFAIILFAGLIIFNFFSEVINRAPALILTNVNYVKKVMFPLEILPVVTVGSALFHTLVSVLVLLCFEAIINQAVPLTALFLPIILLPLLIQALGFAWFLAALGVFLRDVGQTVGILTTALLFLSPIFFPSTALPEALRPYLFLNPLTFIIEQTRGVLIWGIVPDWFGMAVYMLVSMMIAWAGYFWFQKTRKGFADVL